jgi:hypothetical protein
MMRVPGPKLVPAGFTVTTAACVAYMRGDRTVPAGWSTMALRRCSGLNSWTARSRASFESAAPSKSPNGSLVMASRRSGISVTHASVMRSILAGHAAVAIRPSCGRPSGELRRFTP